MILTRHSVRLLVRETQRLQDPWRHDRQDADDQRRRVCLLDGRLLSIGIADVLLLARRGSEANRQLQKLLHRLAGLNRAGLCARDELDCLVEAGGRGIFIHVAGSGEGEEESVRDGLDVIREAEGVVELGGSAVLRAANLGVADRSVLLLRRPRARRFRSVIASLGALTGGGSLLALLILRHDEVLKCQKEEDIVVGGRK